VPPWIANKPSSKGTPAQRHYHSDAKLIGRTFPRRRSLSLWLAVAARCALSSGLQYLNRPAAQRVVESGKLPELRPDGSLDFGMAGVILHFVYRTVLKQRSF
jgi:hypothetical protein